MSTLKTIRYWMFRYWLTGVIGFAIGAIAMWRVDSAGQSVIVDSIEVSDNILTPTDDTISFVPHIDRLRTCPQLVARYLWRWVQYDGKRIKEFRSIDNPPLSPEPTRGQSTYMITLRVPKDFPSGEWFERTVSLEQCPIMGSLLSQPPHVSADRPIVIKDRS